MNTYVILEDWNSEVGAATNISPGQIYLVDIAAAPILQPLEGEEAKEDALSNQALLPAEPADPDPIYSSKSHSDSPSGHKNQAEMLYKCGECGYTGHSSSNLTRHMKSKHTGVKLECEACSYKTRNRGDLKRHQRTKHLDFQLPCDMCDYAASQLTQLNVHKRVKHSDETNYKCGECEFETRYHSAYLRHSQAHTSRFLCAECDYVTNRSDTLKHHVKSFHQHIRVPCELCNYTGASKSSVNNHMKAVHQNLRFTCEVCDYTTARKENLTTHMKNKHAEKRQEKKRLSGYLVYYHQEYERLAREQPWLSKLEKRKMIRKLYMELPFQAKDQFNRKAKEENKTTKLPPHQGEKSQPVQISLKLDPSVMDPSVMALIENPTSVPEYIAATAHVENTSHPSTIPATTTHSTELEARPEELAGTIYVTEEPLDGTDKAGTAPRYIITEQEVAMNESAHLMLEDATDGTDDITDKDKHGGEEDEEEGETTTESYVFMDDTGQYRYVVQEDDGSCREESGLLASQPSSQDRHNHIPMSETNNFTSDRDKYDPFPFFVTPKVTSDFALYRFPSIFLYIDRKTFFF